MIGCGEAGLLAGIRLAQAGLPVHDHREERRSRRHVVGEPLPRRAGRHRQPLLLLLVRAGRPLDRVLLRSSPSCASTSTGCSTKYDVGPHCRFEHRGRRRGLRRGHRPLGASTCSDADGTERDARRPLRDQRGRLAEPAEAARHPGHGRLRRPVVPLGAVGPERRLYAARASRSSARAPAASRSRRRSPTRSSSSPSSSAPRSGCSPTPSYHRAGARRSSGGRCATCRSTAAGSGSSRSTRRRARPSSAPASTPSFDDRDGLAISESNAADPRALRRLDRRAARRRRRPARASRCPTTRPSAKRMLQDNGSWLACLKKPNVELVRTGIERIVADGIVTVDGTLHPADVICYATGFRHNDFLWPMDDRRARRRRAARAVGRRADRVPRHHRAELPEPVLPLRAGHEPGPRRAA